MRGSRIAVALVAGLALSPALAGGAEPARVTYSPVPPGSIVQSRLVYLAGEAMHAQWRAVVSRRPVGRMDNGEWSYQYYLSLYQMRGSTYRLRFQSPKDGGPFTVLAKARGANMWFPFQSARIVGTGEFLAPAVQQVVVQSHEMGADCGVATVTVLAYDEARGRVTPTAIVRNPCDLEASIVNPTAHAELRLKGPYYAPDAALCCPTKPNAVATLRYARGKWVEMPDYFPLSKE